MPEGDDDAADEHAAVLAEETIRDDAAEDRRAPHAARVRAVDRRGVRVRESETAVGYRRHHVEDEERPHPVVAEPLPHLGEKERRESARMAEEAAVLGDGSAHGVTAYMTVGCCGGGAPLGNRWR